MIYSSDDDTVVEKAKPKLKRPKLYKVVLLNDDYTPMEFVVHILTVFFNMNEDKATNIMLQIHHDGKGICGTYSRDIAETKVVQINTYARENEHPLMSVMEEL
jgi:ATP-dependent Clp protease adaptor protein ClpS